MRTLVTNIPPTLPSPTSRQFARGRVVPLGGITSFHLNGQSFRTPCSEEEHFSMAGSSVVHYEPESIRIYPSVRARNILAEIVEEGHISGIANPVCLVSDDGRPAAHITFFHLCKMLSTKGGFLRQSPDEAVRVSLAKRDGSKPYYGFVARHMSDVGLWNLAVSYEDLHDGSEVTSRLVLAS